MTNQTRNAEYHIRGCAVLFELIVDLDPDIEVVGIWDRGFGNEVANWCKRIKSLRSGPRKTTLLNVFLDISGGHVDCQSVSSDVRIRLRFLNITAPLADHNTELNFVVSLDTTRDLNLAPVGKIARGGLEKEEGFFWHRIVQFLDVLHEIPSDGYDLLP